MDRLKQNSYRNKIISAGEIYHVTQRAPGRELLFIENNDYLRMLSLLKKYQKKFGFDIFAFCFMPNHYHILLRINDPNLSEGMHALNTAYGLAFNKKYQRKGHVFCGVYRGVMCLDDAHLIGTSLYIHLNPQKAGIVDSAESYPWSSVGTYIDWKIKSFVDNTFVLNIMNDDLSKASSIYKKMLGEYIAVDYESVIENPRAGINFSKRIVDSITHTLKGRTIGDKFIVQEKQLDEMIERFKKKKRKRTPEEKHGMFYLIEQLKGRGYNITEIAGMIGITRQALYNFTHSVELKV